MSVLYTRGQYMIPKKLAIWHLKWNYCVWIIWNIRLKVPQKETVKKTPSTGHRHLLKISYDCVHFCLSGAYSSPRAHEAICANAGHNRKAPSEWFDMDACERVISELHIAKQQAE